MMQETKHKCSYRGGCNRDAVFECILMLKIVYRCEEHSKRKYFLSREVEIKRIADAKDEPAPPRETDDELPTVPMEDFGKDHWSLLAYVETRCVDYKGELSGDHLRMNDHRHPIHPTRSPRAKMALDSRWNTDWGTRLSGYFEEGGKHNEARHLPDHDDLDCLIDLEKAGLLVLIGEDFSHVKLTELGIKVSHAARVHKINGGQYATFKQDQID